MQGCVIVFSQRVQFVYRTTYGYPSVSIDSLSKCVSLVHPRAQRNYKQPFLTHCSNFTENHGHLKRFITGREQKMSRENISSFRARKHDSQSPNQEESVSSCNRSGATHNRQIAAVKGKIVPFSGAPTISERG